MTRSTLVRFGLSIALSAFAIAPASLAGAPAASPAWPIDKAHSRVTFTVTKWGFSEVEGRFYDFSGAIVYDARRPELSRIDMRVKIASVETGAPSRDQALQSAEYFDAARCPEMVFVSDQVRSVAGNQLDLQGRLTIRGQTRPLTVKVLYGGTHPIPNEGTYDMFQTEFVINRYDFGVVGGSILGPVISKDVRIKLILAAMH